MVDKGVETQGIAHLVEKYSSTDKDTLITTFTHGNGNAIVWHEAAL
jgi:hypothetical protein